MRKIEKEEEQLAYEDPVTSRISFFFWNKDS